MSPWRRGGFGGGRVAGLDAGGGGDRGEVAAADQGARGDRGDGGDGGDGGADEQDRVQAVGEAGPYGGVATACRAAAVRPDCAPPEPGPPSPAAIAWACEPRGGRQPAGDGAAELRGEDRPERGDARRQAGRPQRRVDNRTGM
jgi:hypothetical protein